jgi:hypothetical protein
MLGCASSVYAQPQRGPGVHADKGYESLIRDYPKDESKDSVLIINDSDQKVQFNLKSTAQKGWSSFTLSGNTECVYNHSDEIKIITTGRGEIHYTLMDNERYKIFWNNPRGIWDVVRLVPK